MPVEYVDVKKFKKVVLLYNRNSGKQLFASMMAKVNETYKLVKELVGPKNAEMRDIRFFDQIPQIAAEIVEEKVDWVIIAGGDGTIRAMIEQLANRKYVPYISVFPAGTVNLVAKELLLKADPHKWFKRVSKGIEVPVYLGRANGNVFLTVAGIGFDSLVVDKVTEKEKKLLNKAISRLTERERQIVDLRFGLSSEDGTELTQKEVADMLGISQSYISRLEKKIIKRLKKEIVRYE